VEQTRLAHIYLVFFITPLRLFLAVIMPQWIHQDTTDQLELMPLIDKIQQAETVALQWIMAASQVLGSGCQQKGVGTLEIGLAFFSG
jgi:hypothetical protein